MVLYVSPGERNKKRFICTYEEKDLGGSGKSCVPY